jgi:hypothetical protein
MTDQPSGWQRVPGTANWILPDESGLILRQIVDRGQGLGRERFIVSGLGHVMTEHASLAEAKAAAEASLRSVRSGGCATP